MCFRLHYGSVNEFKSAFSAAVLGFSTSGWLWLVTDQAGNLGIVPTFGPGTLLVRSRAHMGPDKEPILGERPATSPSIPDHSAPGRAPTSPTSGISTPQNPITPKNTHILYYHDRASLRGATSIWDKRFRSDTLKDLDMANTGKTLHPLLCISVNEHAWISAGYGIWGREEWMKEFWSVVNWEKISNAYHIRHPPSSF